MSEDKQMPAPPVRETTEIIEKGSLRGSAAVTGLSPSDQFIPPTMNLDGPPPESGADAPSANE